MSAWNRRASFALGAIVGFLFSAAALAAPPPPDSQGERVPATADRIREAALAAEARGDWEAAFSLQCRLLITDRTPAVREKTSILLRRAQQSRRHRDPIFAQFVDRLTITDALNLYSEVVTKLPTLYADREKAALSKLWRHGVEEFDRALASPAFRRMDGSDPLAAKQAEFRASLRELWENQPAANAREARNQLRKLAHAAVEAGAVRKPTSVVVEFLCGACTGLDDYTVFLTPAQASLDAELSLPDLQTYGIFTTITETGLKVQGIVPNSWAALNTPLAPGDRILRVNGRLFNPGSPAELAESLRNVGGTTHRLEIVLPVPDMQPVVELPATVPTVYGAAIVSPKEGIGYLRVGAFRDSTPRELDDAIDALKNQGLRSLVLDVRGNHGGLFLSGIQATQRFLPAGIIVATRGQSGEFANRVFSSDSGMLAHDFPLILLIDGETASAAEVLAGALKDHQRATLIGLPTFGKGSIQFPVRLEALDDTDAPGAPRFRSGAVRLTIAKFVSPRGSAINGQGVTPHILEPDPLRQLEIAVLRAIEQLPPPMMP